MLNDNYEEIIKVLILGDCSVGKTNILTRYCTNSFNSQSKATIGIDFLNKDYSKNGKNYKVQIFDTAGQEKFKSFIKTIYKGTNGVILVFDVTNKDTFNNIDKWYKDAKDSIDKNFSCILVGNKIDLTDSREVKTEEGKNKAQGFGMFYMETSAKDSINVEQAFNELLSEVCEKLSSETEEENEKIILDLGKNVKNEAEKEKEKKCC